MNGKIKKRDKNILLVYPKYPENFWSFKYALKFISKKASYPPLGLLTVSALLPGNWDKKLVDMNVEKLSDDKLDRADLVFISGMSVQKESAVEVIKRCNEKDITVVAGGPIFTSGYKEFPGVNHFVLNEAEITLPRFLKDLKEGNLKRVYKSSRRADMEKSPDPDLSIINENNYASMCIQTSRGCPFNFDFCNITQLFGHRLRVKSAGQILRELNDLYERGWRGKVFFVDDNFTARRKSLKKDVLPAVIEWMKEKKYPFSFLTQASLDLSDDIQLIKMLVRAGFDTVFVGIETTSDESLSECKKTQNRNRNMIECVHRMQRYGLRVQGGFIIGFDSDPGSIFNSQIKFIQESGIVTAMVGLLNALKGTGLYEKLKREKRLLNKEQGNNTNFSLNFRPKMNYSKLIRGYRKVIATIYNPRNYYRRVKKFLKNYPIKNNSFSHIDFNHLRALFKSLFRLGVLGRERFYFWELIFWSIIKKPRLFPLAVTYSIYGFHFRKVFEKYL